MGRKNRTGDPSELVNRFVASCQARNSGRWWGTTGSAETNPTVRCLKESVKIYSYSENLDGNQTPHRWGASRFISSSGPANKGISVELRLSVPSVFSCGNLESVLSKPLRSNFREHFTPARITWAGCRKVQLHGRQVFHSRSESERNGSDPMGFPTWFRKSRQKAGAGLTGLNWRA